MTESIVHLAQENGFEAHSEAFAQWLDQFDPLKDSRAQYHQPTFDALEKTAGVKFLPPSERPFQSITYLCGQSFGLQPTGLSQEIQKALQQWATLGVHAYNSGYLPASWCDKQITIDTANLIVGADPSEVAITANLSVNMHSLLSTFYCPSETKFCVLMEHDTFSTDVYAVESHIAWHGLDPAECILRISPRPGEWCLRTEDILATLRSNADRIALVWLMGVHYITGQAMDMETITKATHEIVQCPIGWDLAHSVGNVPLELHQWNVDIAVWCSYKFLNASPGGLGGLFVHSRHHHKAGTHGPAIAEPGCEAKGPRLTGWWGHDEKSRFEMTGQMALAPGAAAYRISNPPLLLAVALRCSLDLIRQWGGMQPIRAKSILLTGYLDHLLRNSPLAQKTNAYTIITPEAIESRGALLSIIVHANVVDRLTQRLTAEGFIFDRRQSTCLRVTPCPLYNSFVEVYRFATRFSSLVEEYWNPDGSV